MTIKDNSRVEYHPAERIKALAWDIWCEEPSHTAALDPVSACGTSALDRPYSNSEREFFDLFVQEGYSETFASAMIEFIRRPCTQHGDWTLVKDGVSITAYMDQLADQPNVEGNT